MHIAILCEYPTLHGGERSLLAVIDELRRQQVDVEFTVLAPAAGPLAEALAVHTVRHVAWSSRVEIKRGEQRPFDEALLRQVRSESEISPDLVQAISLTMRRYLDRIDERIDEKNASLRQALSEIGPDLVHANSLSMGRCLGGIAARISVPCTAHLRDIIGLSAAAVSDLNRNARLVAVSEATRAFHLAQGVDASKLDVIYNGVDLVEFQPRSATGWLKRELGLPDSARLVVTIGQIGLRKGWDVLADAAVPVAIRHPEVHFLLIGARHSGKEESRAYAADVRVRFQSIAEDRAHWLGERDDVARILNEVDVLVHPAHQEPLGRVLLEALASGVPIVATDVGGTREIIEPEVSGLLVPPRDAQRLASAMDRLLSAHKLAEQFRIDARRRAERSFDVRQAAARLWEFWRRIEH